jgi:peptidyl-prolyl cis-trans isomerase D
MIRFLQTPTQVKKYVLGGILLFVSISMLFYLIPGFGDQSGTSGRGVYARVGDQEITTQMVETTADRVRQQQQLPAQFIGFILPRVADSLVTDAALVSEGHRLGLHVTDDELRDDLQNGPLGAMLFPDGNFIGQDRYEGLVENQFRMSVDQFEQLLKEDLVKRKLTALIQSGVNVPESQIQQEFKKQHQQVKFEYAVLNTEQMLKDIKPTEAELKAYYDSHKAQYANANPEKRKARYVVVDSTRLSNVAPPTDSELRQYYAQHKDQFSLPERANVRHILIKTPAPGPDGKVDQKVLDAARAKAEDLLKQIKNGANFADLAKKNSEDPGSAKQGGELGWFEHGRMVPEFDKAAFALNQKGQLSDLVKTTYGFHIIQLIDKQPAHVRTFDEVKAEIAPIVESDKKGKAAENEANAVYSEARARGLEKAAADHHLEIVTSDYFSQNDSLPGLGSAPDFMQAAFTVKPKSAPELARTAQGYAIFEITDSKPPSTPTFEEARARVEAEFRNQRSQEMLTKKTQELSERARALHDLKQAAKELGATLKTSELVTAQSQVPDLGSMSGQAAAAFDLAKGQISGPLYPNRNGVVLEVVEQQEPSAAEYEKGKQLARDTVLQKKRNEVFEVYAASLKDRMEKEGKIKYNKEEQQRLLARSNAIGG